MPVNFDEYAAEQGEYSVDVDPDTNAYRILSFLGDYPEQGFKPSEVAEEIDVKPGSVRVTLHRLEERGLVRHSEPYWAIGEDDRLAAFVGTVSSLHAIEDRYSDDDFEGWDETAVDPRERRGE